MPSLTPVAGGGGGGAPTGAAGGDLTGTYPNPHVVDGVITDAKVAAANKDGTTSTPSLRTLGTGAQQAMPGDATPGGLPAGSAGGDLTGTYPNPGVRKLAGVTVSGTPSAGQEVIATNATTASWQTPTPVVAVAPTGVAATDTATVLAASVAGLPLADGTYVCTQTGLQLAANTRLRIKGQGSSRTTIQVASNSDKSANITCIGSAVGSAYNLSVNAFLNDTTLTISSANASALGANPGDYLHLWSSQLWTTTVAQGAVQGEIVRVKSVNTGTGVITIYGTLDDIYLMTDTARLRKLSLLDGCYIEGVTIQNTTPGAGTGGLVAHGWTRNFRIRDVLFIGADRPAVECDDAIGFNLEYKVRDLTDVPGSDQLGYGCLVFGASRDGLVAIEAERCRHAFTTGGSHLSGFATNPQQCGVPRHINVVGQARETTSNAWDTHSEGEDICFWVTAHGCFAPFQARAKNCKLMSYDFVDCLGPATVEWTASGFRAGPGVFTNGKSASGDWSVGSASGLIGTVANPGLSGSPITSLPLTSGTAVPLGVGTQIIVTSGTHSQVFTVSTAAAVGVTSIPINSATPNFAYPTSAPVTGNVNDVGIVEYTSDNSAGSQLQNCTNVRFVVPSVNNPASTGSGDCFYLGTGCATGCLTLVDPTGINALRLINNNNGAAGAAMIIGQANLINVTKVATIGGSPTEDTTVESFRRALNLVNASLAQKVLGVRRDDYGTNRQVDDTLKIDSSGVIWGGDGTGTFDTQLFRRGAAQWGVVGELQTLPAATNNSILSSKFTRTDVASYSSASNVITDASVIASDNHKAVTGFGIPANSFVGTVTAGVSFQLSSSSSSQVNVSPTQTGTAVTISDVAATRFQISADGSYWVGDGATSTTQMFGRGGSGEFESVQDLWVGGGMQQNKIAATYGSTVTPDRKAGGWNTITVTDANAFTINAPSNTPISSRTAEITLEIINSSGGVMGAVTWDPTYIFPIGSWTNPVDAKKRYATFTWNGANWVCTSLASDDYDTAATPITTPVPLAGLAPTVASSPVLSTSGTVAAYGSSSTLAEGTRVNSVYTAPTGISNGDIIQICHFEVIAGGGQPPTPTPPAGFATLAGVWPMDQTDGGGEHVNVWMWEKVAASESGNYTVTHTSCISRGMIVRITGADTTTPVAPTPTQNHGLSATTTSWTGLTTAVDNELILAYSEDFNNLNLNLSPPAGTTPTFIERIDDNHGNYLATGLLTTAGPTGNLSMTNNNHTGADPYFGILVAMRPLAAGTVANPVVGQTLNSSTGGWGGNPTSFTYQWKQDAGTTIVSATSSSYTLVSGDVGHTIFCVVTATNGVGSTNAGSNSAGTGSSTPTNTVLPVISGNAVQGQVLSASPGTWTGGALTGAQYQWKRAGVAIGAAVANSYTLVAGDVGNVITVTVVVTNAAGTGTATSTGTASVTSSGGASAPSLSVLAGVISWSAIGGATGYKGAISTAPRGDPTRVTTSYTELGVVTSWSPSSQPGSTLYYGVAAESAGGDAWSAAEVSIAWSGTAPATVIGLNMLDWGTSTPVGGKTFRQDAFDRGIRVIRAESGAFSVASLQNAISIGLKAVQLYPGYSTSGVSGLGDPVAYANSRLTTYQANYTPTGVPWIEVLNEPYGNWFWGSNANSNANAQAFVNMIKAFYNAFTNAYGANRPKILAHIFGDFPASSPVGTADEFNWYQQIIAYEPNIMNWLDGAVVHPYGGTGSSTISAQGNKNLVTTVHNLTGKPVYCTELGWPTAVGFSNTGDSLQWTEAQQATNITNFCVWAKATGYVAMMNYFQVLDYGLNSNGTISNAMYGLIRWKEGGSTVDFTAKPGYAALTAQV